MGRKATAVCPRRCYRGHPCVLPEGHEPIASSQGDGHLCDEIAAMWSDVVKARWAEAGREASVNEYPLDATKQAVWDATACTCKAGAASERHFLACAKWRAVLPAVTPPARTATPDGSVTAGEQE